MLQFDLKALPSTEKQHILVVDDDPAICNTLQHILQKQGYTVTTARTAEEGLRLFQIQGADLAILDVKIPDMYGFEVSQTIKYQKEIPVVFLTGSLHQDAEQMARDAGADSVLRKPLDAEKLKKTVSRFLH